MRGYHGHIRTRLCTLVISRASIIAVTSKDKKVYLRLAIVSIYLVGMMLLYGLNDDVVWWFWMWPLFIAIFFYNFILWGGRCPHCRRDFALEAVEQGYFLTTWQCRVCKHETRRINMDARGGGGGGP